jgi:polygalacturonase
VIFNGNVNKALHVFANPLETDVPDKDDENVFYIGPGEWVMDAISLQDNQTLYISGGAVLHSIISVANAKNVRICGRGMIDGSDYPAWNQAGSYARVPIDLNHSRDVTVEGISIVNSNCWNLNSYSSRNVTIDNVKIISGRQNGDGFTFESCTNHTVTNCFARTWDDSLVIKNYSGSTKGITFRNIQVWTDLAQSMEIGYETDKGLTLDPEISDVLFEDITVLYNFHKPVISIHNSDDAFVHDITYRNITVENAFMQGDNGNNKELIEMTLQNSAWSTVRDEFGSIDNVLIDGLTVLNTVNGKVPRSRFAGHDEEHMITNVTFRNVTILGERIEDVKGLKLSLDEFCDAITVQ